MPYASRQTELDSATEGKQVKWLQTFWGVMDHKTAPKMRKIFQFFRTSQFLWMNPDRWFVLGSASLSLLVVVKCLLRTTPPLL